jgi:hypothetical protein
VSANDVMSYIAGTLANPAFTARFASNLGRPGLRLPLTGTPDLFAEAVALGREIIWLYLVHLIRIGGVDPSRFSLE